MNAVKRKLAAGEVAVVAAGHSGSSDNIDLMGSLGFGGFWIEGEHGPMGWERIGDRRRTADLWGMAALVRVSRLDSSLIARSLSLGVRFLYASHDAWSGAAARYYLTAARAPGATPKDTNDQPSASAAADEPRRQLHPAQLAHPP